MIYHLVALVCGIIFGSGLTISMMINPTKVQNFLDITGNWDPSLLFVMLGAVMVTWLGYQFTQKLPRPLLEEKFFLPEKKALDSRLILGATLFGIGWGLAGYCPGPGFTALGIKLMDAVYFVLGMIASLIAYPLLAALFKKI